MSLQVWLPLTGDLHNQGVSNITITNSGATVDTTGKIGSCYAFNGSSKMTATNVSISSSPISACCWLYLNNNITDLQYLISLNASVGFADHQIGLAIQSSKYYFVAGGNFNAAVGTPVLNTWVHMAVTFDGSTIKGYINGTEVASVASTTTLSRTNFTIGARNNGGTNYAYFLKGKINDVRIYDHCLSAAEVHEIAQGLVLHYKLDSFQGGYGNPNLITGYDTSFLNYNDGAVTLFTNQMNGGAQEIVSNIPGASKCLHLHSSGGSNRQYRTIAATSGKSYTISVDYYSTSNQNIALHCELNGGNYSWTQANGLAYTTPGKWIRLSATYTNLTSNATLYYFIYCTNGTDCYVKNFKIEEGMSATNWTPDNTVITVIEDSSGYNHNGLAINSPTLLSNTARYSASLSFNGSNQYIRAYRNGMVRDAVTINIWAKMDTWTNTPGRFVSCTEGGGWNFEYGSNGRINFACGTGESANAYKSALSPADKTYSALASGWHMFTGTYDGFASKLYVDGVLLATNNAYTTKTPLHYHGSNGIFLGAEAAGKQDTPSTPYFGGQLSDFRIYATALSAADILSLYHTGARMDNLNNLHTFSFEEKDGNYSIISLFNGGAYDETTTGKISAAVYSRAISPAPRQTNATISANHYSYIYTTKFSLNNYGDYKITIPTCTITPYPYTYTSTYWRRRGSTYIKVNNTPRYGRFAYIRVYLILYNSNYEELGSELIKSAQYIKTESDSSSLSSDPISLSGTYNFNLPFDFSQYDDIAYGSLKVEMAGNSPDAGTEFSVVEKFSTSTPQLLKTGVFINKQIHEQTTDKIQFLFDGTFNIEQAIEV